MGISFVEKRRELTKFKREEPIAYLVTVKDLSSRE